MLIIGFAIFIYKECLSSDSINIRSIALGNGQFLACTNVRPSYSDRDGIPL